MSQRSRALLHINKLEDFKSWCEKIGYEVLQTKGEYEVPRLKKDKVLIIGYKRDKTNHVTLTDAGISLFKRFKNVWWLFRRYTDKEKTNS